MHTRYLLIVLGWLVGAPALLAQVPAEPKPQKEHEWLQKFVGTWETESEASMGPGQPPMHWKGIVKCRMLGGFWVVNEWQGGTGDSGDKEGTQMKGLQTIGYDTIKKKYVGTWVDSMTNHMWHYEGFIEKGAKKIVLEATGPNFMADGKETRFRDAYEFKSDDEIIVTSSMLGEDGKWLTFMTGTARRQK